MNQAKRLKRILFAVPSQIGKQRRFPQSMEPVGADETTHLGNWDLAHG